MGSGDGGNRADDDSSRNEEDSVRWAIDHADLDSLTAAVDSICLDARFADLVELRHRCRAAVHRGLQLWPVAAYCDYRLALEAPAPLALTGLGETSERFMLGPFAEVVASTHTFAELSEWLPRSPDAAAVAHECVVRGEDLRADEAAKAFPDVFGLPLALCPWEPTYATAFYAPDRARFDAPNGVAPTEIMALRPGTRVRDPLVSGALADLVSPWVAKSNGRVDVASVEGRAEMAIAALGLGQAAIVEISAQDAIAQMAWAAASGGAVGRRRGASAGRQVTWWALRALTGLDDEEIVDADELGEAVGELRWYRWNDGSPDTGWSLRLAIEDQIDGVAWAIAAIDAP